MNTRAQSELDYRRLVETAHEGIWLIGADARTRYVNPRMAQMLGDAPDRLLGASMFEFMSEPWKPIAQRHFERRHSAVDRYDLQLTSKSGLEFWASISSHAFADGTDGRDVGALALVTDVSEQRKHDTDSMIQQRLVAAGSLAAGVVHEINNPLAGVIANLELALPGIDGLRAHLGDAPQLAALREHLIDARDSARRVQSIIKDLRVFARSEDDERRPVDVRRLLDSALQVAADEVRQRAKLVKDYAEVPAVDANESRLGQVFLNLLLNAAQAIPAGHADANEIRVACRTIAGDKLAITISDTGIGMSSDLQARLFTPFFTTEAPGARRGLGLAVCHRIVSALDGHISVTSQVGRGSTFVVVLPAARTPASRTSPLPPEQTDATRRGRVLVVDDEVMMTTVIARTLSNDHDVDTTTAAKEALRMLASGQRFDVILCDLMMPHMTGMDFHAEVARTNPDQARRIIFLTGGAFTPRMRSFLDSSDNLCLEKPFEPSTLRAIVNRRVCEP